MVYLLQEEDKDLFQTINDFLNSPVLAIGFRVVLLCFVVLWLALAYWTFADAGRRGTVRFFWGAVALIVPSITSTAAISSLRLSATTRLSPRL